MVGLSETRIVQRRIRRAWQQLLKGVNGGALSTREIGVTLSLLFSRRWWWKTLIVLLAMAAMAALGFWQLDRLDQRRAFNLQRRAALAAPPFELTGAPSPCPQLIYVIAKPWRMAHLTTLDKFRSAIITMRASPVSI